jgi:putative ABC transport system substrate-binding protein
MRRRDFTTGLLLASAARMVRAQEPVKQHRIAIVISTGPVTRINDPASRVWQALWQELRRLGDVEGQNLTVERYSGEGRPEGFADLAREVVSRNPDVILAIGPPITLAVSAATGTIPIVATGTHTSSGIVPSLARPGGNFTGVRVEGYRSMESACRSSRKLSLRHPGSRSWTSARSGKVPAGNKCGKSFARRAKYWESR